LESARSDSRRSRRMDAVAETRIALLVACISDIDLAEIERWTFAESQGKLTQSSGRKETAFTVGPASPVAEETVVAAARFRE
jgi:hypothetical protein